MTTSSSDHYKLHGTKPTAKRKTSDLTASDAVHRPSKHTSMASRVHGTAVKCARKEKTPRPERRSESAFAPRADAGLDSWRRDHSALATTVRQAEHAAASRSGRDRSSSTIIISSSSRRSGRIRGRCARERGTQSAPQLVSGPKPTSPIHATSTESTATSTASLARSHETPHTDRPRQNHRSTDPFHLRARAPAAASWRPRRACSPPQTPPLQEPTPTRPRRARQAPQSQPFVPYCFCTSSLRCP